MRCVLNTKSGVRTKNNVSYITLDIQPHQSEYVPTKRKGGTHMEVRYNATGKDRKRMAQIIGKVIGVDPMYNGTPSLAYQIDQFTIDKEGTLIFDETRDEYETETVLRRLEDEGFEAEEPPYMAIQMPMMTGDEISRLESLIESKESLLKKALGTDNLMIGEKDGKLDFPWFQPDVSPDEVKAYMDLVTALCKKATQATRVTGKDKQVDNEKYAFRCFLLRLGFIGDEYKNTRKVLLKNLSGSSAFKNGGKKDEISK